MLLQISHLAWYHQTFRGTPVSGYIWFGAIVVAALALKKPLSRLIARISSGMATRFSQGEHGPLFRELVRKPLEWLLAVILFFIALNQIGPMLAGVELVHLRRTDGLQTVTLYDIAEHVFLFTVILFTTLTLSRIVDFAYRVQQDQAVRAQEKSRLQLLPLLKDVVKVLVWATAFFWMLGVVFHVNIPALITGLGIGGLAFALAAKESVENLFASFTILADKPFQADDTIRLGSLEGKVERIGFRSTRLRGGDGSLYIIPNKKLVDENLENLTQRDTRGVKLVVNLKYGMPAARLQEMLDGIRTAVRDTLHVTQPVDVSVESFNEKAFQVVVSYHVPQLQHATIPEIQREINLKIYDIVQRYSGEAPSQPPPKGEE